LQEKHRTGYSDLKGAWIKMIICNDSIRLDREMSAMPVKQARKASIPDPHIARIAVRAPAAV
jgi:hypothetical protein